MHAACTTAPCHKSMQCKICATSMALIQKRTTKPVQFLKTIKFLTKKLLEFKQHSKVMQIIPYLRYTQCTCCNRNQMNKNIKHFVYCECKNTTATKASMVYLKSK